MPPVSNVTLDGITVDTGVSASDRITSDNTPTLSGLLDATSKNSDFNDLYVAWSTDGGITWTLAGSVLDVNQGTSIPWTLPITTPLADGEYLFGWSTRPNFNKFPPTPFSGPVVIDTVPPPTPVFFSGDLDVQPNELVGGQTYVYQTEPGAIVTVTFTQGSTTITKTATADASGFASVTLSEAELIALGTGVVDVKAQASDIAGNQSGVLDVPNIDLVICYLEGTRIATPSGDVAVETLKPGDLVLTADGRTLPVRFLGRQTIASRFVRAKDHYPIRIAAGALGENLPVRDLFVSRGHAIAFGDVLVQAGALVNGTTIRQLTEMPETFTYCHVELAEHALLLAEGVAAESFLDSAEPTAFHNNAERPEFPPIPELDMPRARSHRQVPQHIRALIAERAAALSAQDTAAA